MLCYNTFMKLVLKNIIIILILFSFSACQLFEDSLELQDKKQVLALKKLQVAQEKELAQLEMQKSLAEIEKEKIIELQKMQNDIKEKELSANSEKELELIKQKLALQESNNTLQLQMYLLAFLALVITVIVFFIFYFLRKRREDELRAYNDNLKKYFNMKENESRFKIAQKILDTISEGDISSENQQKLINVFAEETSASQTATASFTKETSASQTTTDALTSQEDDYENDAEIIDAITHKKDRNEV